jgi:hypothetical protein
VVADAVHHEQVRRLEKLNRRGTVSRER